MSATPSPDASVAHLDQVSDLEITTIYTGANQAIVEVRGELDFASAGLLRIALDNELRLGRRFIRLDVSRLDFCDCSGLRAIVAGHEALLTAGGALRVTGLTQRLARLLSITHLDEELILSDRSAVVRQGSRRHPDTAPPS